MINPFKDKSRLCFTLACLLLILSGCANTVTLKERPGTTVTFSITFDSTPSFSNYSYYIVYGNSNFNLNSSLNSNYFFIPGENFEQTAVDSISNAKGLIHFYETYFQTWGGVLTLKPTDITLTKGPFSESTNSDDEHFSYASTNLSINNYQVSGATISFTVPVSDLTINGNLLFFSIITTKGDEENNTQDMVSDIQSIEIISNRPPVTGQNDTSLFQPETGAKIVSWTVSVL
jgi:hypothetical protein